MAAEKPPRIDLCRVHDAVHDPPRGRVFLVDRLWPRGVRKEALSLDGWPKEAAPSNELRKWFGHDPAKWDEFRRRYVAELESRPEALDPLLEAVRQGPVTLLYGAKDPEHNQAVVLRDHLLEHARR
ncbi:DUF488 domain-containing protein [Nocardiopsis sediminis]|uniref:DUF488 domain-containing protein n=1 Tax=Nocardiopsis sediminis TaxID=1778267 RepID=A0ABV8FEF2_9ACTN